jgi:hypothetical protein
MNIAPWFQGAVEQDTGARLLETESILRQAARFCRTAKKWAGILPTHFC